MKKTLVISIVFNILLLLFAWYTIHKKGGINFLRTILISQDQESFSEYYKLKTSVFEMMPNDTNEIIFLGNSLTDCNEWHELFSNPNIKNRGISQDNINRVINRIDEVVESNPSKIFLLIGTNDLGQIRSIDNILKEYEKLVKLILEKSPETELYLQSLPPKLNSLRGNQDIIKMNKGIKEICLKFSLTYIDLFKLFSTANNELNRDLSHDGIHLNGKGYLIWRDALVNYVEN